MFASSDERRAAQIKASLEREIEEPVEVIRQGDTWKVVVGRFPDQAAARLYLEQIRQKRFGDAWITQIIRS